MPLPFLSISQPMRGITLGSAADSFSTKAGQCLPQVLVRVDRGVVNLDLVVDMIAGGLAAVAYEPDNLAADDSLAADNVESGHVAVDGLETVAVIDDDFAAVPVLKARSDNDTIGCGPNRSTDGSGDVDAGVELAFAVTQDWIFTLTEAAGDGSHNGPEIWGEGHTVGVVEAGDVAKTVAEG